MDDLIARLEAATGPDRGLDAEIARTLGDAGRDFWFTDMTGQRITNALCPRYTASIDAAMTLVDPDCFFHISRFSSESNGEGQAHVYPNRAFGDDYEADAATPALALCIAALKARLPR